MLGVFRESDVFPRAGAISGMYDRVIFQAYQEGSADKYGNVTAATPTDIAEVWGELVERTGKETMDAGAINDRRMALLRVRWNETLELLTSGQVLARGAAWDIMGVMHMDNRRRMLEFTLQRRESRGF